MASIMPPYVFPKNLLIALYGPPGCGKTFAADYLCELSGMYGKPVRFLTLHEAVKADTNEGDLLIVEQVQTATERLIVRERFGSVFYIYGYKHGGNNEEDTYNPFKLKTPSDFVCKNTGNEVEFKKVLHDAYFDALRGWNKMKENKDHI